MPRQINDMNQIWYEKSGEVTQIGFTQEFLNSLDQCWHILPANLERFKEKSPLLTIETNDALVSIVSPISGNFMEFSNKAQNFPNKLTENDVVLSISDRRAVERPAGFVRPQVAQPQVVRPQAIVPGAIVWNADNPFVARANNTAAPQRPMRVQAERDADLERAIARLREQEMQLARRDDDELEPF